MIINYYMIYYSLYITKFNELKIIYSRYITKVKKLFDISI